MRVHSLKRGDQGAVAIIVALLLTVFMILAAFALDIGNAYANARQLSVAADAASLAAAAKVGEAYTKQFPNAACSPTNLTTVNATQIARDEADRINTANNKTGVSEPVDTVSVTCEDANKSIQVSIANNREVRTVLAGIIGISSIKPNSYAIARYQKSTIGGGLRPWAVCASVVVAAEAHPDTTYWTALGNWNNKSGDAGICGTSSAPGTWGSVDFNGGSNGTPELIDWTLNGYPDSITIPNPTMPADTGVKTAVGTALQSLIGKVVLFPAVASISGNGSNATFDTVGAATVKVCAIYYSNQIYNIDATTGLQSDCWANPSASTSTTITTAPGAGGAMTKNQTTLTTTDSPFTAAMVNDPDVTVTVPGAGPGGANLISPITAFTSARQVELTDKAKSTVTGKNITITTTTTTTVPGSLGVPVDKSGNVIDHIQFRWVSYTTSYSGPGGTTCNLGDPLCVGTTVLWK